MASEWNTLITSGAYIGEEMQAEFGRIPPAFLPVGAAFLIQHQLREANFRKNVWVSLPNDYELTPSQDRLLTGKGVRIFRAEPGRSLGLSVFQAILEIGPNRPLEIMHGDTLVLAPPMPSSDVVSASRVAEHYKWGLIDLDDGRVCGVRDADRSDTISPEALILSGYFAFCEPWRLLKCLVARDFSFTGALDAYATEVVLAVDESIVALDCGHLKTYYSSRRNLAAARHFNSVRIEGGVVFKRSDDKRKLDAEANWLRSVPAELQPFTARLIEDKNGPPSGEYYTLYSSYPTLSELYLARTPQFVWGRILKSCLYYLEKAAIFHLPHKESPFEWLVIGKLAERMARYPDFLPNPDAPLTINGQSVGTLNRMFDKLAEVLARAPTSSSCIMHGDFCFSNILYDMRADRIQLIDPRGLIGDEMTIYGDIRYDIAKLGHSILGRYDQILGERIEAGGSGHEFTLNIPRDPLRDRLEQDFLGSRIANQRFDAEEVKAAIVSLFLSMIPLHAEDPVRQRALFANGLRLFRQFFATSIGRDR